MSESKSKRKTVAVSLPQELLDQINNYRRSRPNVPNLSQAIRTLIKEALECFYPDSDPNFLEELEEDQGDDDDDKENN